MRVVTSVFHFFWKKVGGISGIRASVNYPWLWVIKQCKSMGIWRDFPLAVHCLGWCHLTWSLWYPFYLAGFLPLGPECELFLLLWVTSLPKDHWTLKTGYFEDPYPLLYRFKPFHWRGPRSLGLYIFLSNLLPPQKVFFVFELNRSAMADDFSWRIWWSLRLNSVVPAMARWRFFFRRASAWMWWVWLAVVFFCLGDGQVICFREVIFP